MKNTIINDWKIAFKNKDLVKKSALEAIKAKILLAEKSGQFELPLTDEQIQNIVGKEIKEIQDSMQYYSKDSVDYINFTYKINVLEEYLPKQLTEDEVIDIIKNIIENNPDEKNKGKLIGLTVKEIGNKFDKSKIAGLVNRVML